MARKSSSAKKPPHAKRLRKQYCNNPIKFTPKKSAEFISFAQKIIREQAQLLPKAPKKEMFPRMRQRNPKQLNAIISKLKNTNKTLSRISSETGAGHDAVGRVYRGLKVAGIQMQERTTGSFQKDKKRITNFFTKKQINELVKEYEPNIVAKAWKIYNSYRNIFNKAGVGAGDIAQFIRLELPWKLQIFDPQKKKGDTQEIKIRNYCLWHINNLGLDVKRTSERKAKEKISLDQEREGGKGGKKAYLKDSLSKKVVSDADPEKLIKLIETMSKTAKLNHQEKAVLYAKAIEMEQRKTAEIVGVGENRISQVVRSLKSKMEKAGYKI